MDNDMKKSAEKDTGAMEKPVSKPTSTIAKKNAANPSWAYDEEPRPKRVSKSKKGADSKSSKIARKKRRKRRRIFFTVLLVLLLLIAASAAGAGVYVLKQLDRIEATRQQADAIKAQGDYALALDAYALLLENDPLSFTPFTNAYVSAGADGVVACADALLETSEGAHYLEDSGALQNVLSHATHPAVPDGLKPALERRSLLCKAILAEEEGDLALALDLLNQADLRPELAYPIKATLDRNAALAAAYQAKEEGRYEDALQILTQTVLDPELVAQLQQELQQRIIDEKDASIKAKARAAMDAMDPDGAIHTLVGLSRPEDQLAMEQAFREEWNSKLNQFHETYENRLFAGAWFSLALGDVPTLTGDGRYNGLTDAIEGDGKMVGGMFSLIQLNNGRVKFLGDTLGAEAAVSEITDAKDAALGLNHGLNLHENGTVTNIGVWQYGRKAVSEWTDIEKVAAGGFHSLGLKKDGTVVAAGLNLDGQCKVTKWSNVVAIAAGLRHSVALTREGRLLATGDNTYGQCDVSQWENVIAVRCGGNYTLALTADWRLLAAGDNSCSQCNVSGWQEVVAFDAGLWHTVALLSDGRVVTTGSSVHDQCDLEGAVLFTSSRKLDRATRSTVKEETEYAYTGSSTDGPWMYYNTDGCLIITYDGEVGKLNPTRADLICTAGHPPVGILAGGGDKPAHAEHAAKVAKENRAVFALTGDYFTFGYNRDGLQVRRGTVFKEFKDEKAEVAFGFYPDGSMRIIDSKTTTGEQLLAQGVRDSWVFGPTLVLDGKAVDISGHPLSYNDVTMRTVMASLCPYHHMAVTYGVTTLAQVTDHLLQCGATIAYNLDGGRSCMMVFMGTVVNRSRYLKEGWRGLQDMIGFLTSDLVPKA